MQIKDLAAKLNTTHTSISNWIKRFDLYFSDNVKQRNRSFTQEDLDLLATIAKLSASGMSYDLIEQQLQSGERVNFEDTTLGTDTRMVPAMAMEQMIDATEIRMELERTRSDLARALDMLETERSTSDTLRDKIDALQQEIRTLERELGRAQGELDYRRSKDG